MKFTTFHKALIYMLILLACPVGARSQNRAYCDTTVWFVNIYPGQEIYELEGHSAIRIKTCDDDIAVNYGMFSFETPNFVYRFVKGETDYMVGVIPWELFINQYRAEGRRIVAHRLNLNQSQKKRLMELLKQNLLPQNRVYRYNYVLDNCATRPLRTIELATGDSLILPEPASEITPSLDTFRKYMSFYHTNYPWYQFGIDLALGNGIDRPITTREKSFAPIVLDNQIVGATIGSGSLTALVSETEILNAAAPYAVELDPTPWYLTPDFIFWILFVAVAGYSIFSVARRKSYPRVIATIFFAMFGLAGLLITFLICISVHFATSPNANILWLNPLCLYAVAGLWVKKLRRINLYYFALNLLLLIATLTVWLIGYQQPNSAFIPLLLIDAVLTATYLYNYLNHQRENKKS